MLIEASSGIKITKLYVDNEEHGRPPKKSEDAELESLLDVDDDCWTKMMINSIIT